MDVNEELKGIYRTVNNSDVPLAPMLDGLRGENILPFLEFLELEPEEKASYFLSELVKYFPVCINLLKRFNSSENRRVRFWSGVGLLNSENDRGVGLSALEKIAIDQFAYSHQEIPLTDILDILSEDGKRDARDLVIKILQTAELHLAKEKVINLRKMFQHD